MVAEDCGDLSYCLYEINSSRCLPCLITDMVSELQTYTWSHDFNKQRYGGDNDWLFLDIMTDNKVKPELFITLNTHTLVCVPAAMH